MAIGIGVSAKVTTDGSSSTGTTTAMATQASGSILVAGMVFDNTVNFVSLAENKGNGAPTQIGSELAFGSAKVRFYYWQNAVGGAGHTCTLTLDAAAAKDLQWVEITGGALTSSLDAAPAAVTDASSPFQSASTGVLAQANEAVVSFIATANGTNSAFAESTGFTIQQSEPNGISFWTAALATKLVSATIAQQASWTQASATNSGVCIASFKEFGSVAVNVPMMGQACL